MNLSSQHILTGTIFAGYEHRSIRRCDLFHGLPDGSHSARCAPIHFRSFASLRMTYPLRVIYSLRMTYPLRVIYSLRVTYPLRVIYSFRMTYSLRVIYLPRMTTVPCHSEAFGRRIPSHRLPGLVTGRRERGHKFVILPRLHDEVKRPALHPFHCQLDIGIRGEQHHFYLGHHLLELPDPVEAFVPGIDGSIEIHIQ